MKRPEINLAFSEMEIHYMKGGGWINTSVLDIDGTGEVKAYLIRHASSVILDSARMILNDSEKERLVELSSSFSTYEDYYQPSDYRTNQDDHSLVLIHEQIPDTVRVYDPGRVDLPDGLRRILEEMESFWEETLGLPLSLGITAGLRQLLC